jgi:hypothetical protein
MIADRFAGVTLAIVAVTLERGEIAPFRKAIGDAGSVRHGAPDTCESDLQLPAPQTLGFTVKALTGQPSRISAR